MSKRSNLLWITGLILGWAFDLLFWKQSLGINFTLYCILCVLGALLILLLNKQLPARGTWLVFPLILIFALIPGLRSEPMTVFLAICFALLLMVVLANTYAGGHWLQYQLWDYVGGVLRLVASMIGRPVAFSLEVRKERLEAGAPAKRLDFWPVLRGIIIAVPIVAIFAALLASADAAFRSQLEAFLKLLAIENLPEYIFRMVYILIGAYLLVGVILHASTQSADEKLSAGGKPVVSPFLGFTETTIVLGSVAVLFAAFVAIQLRYFFGGAANINVAGFTYAEYARRGFGELVAVAFFSLLLILGLQAITRRERAVQRRVFSGLSAAIVALVLVMLVSAYQRLVLYETAYGFSRLRTYTHVALIWIGLLLVAVVVLEALQRERAFVLAMLVTAVGFGLSLAILNVDGLIAKQNVERALRGEGLDVSYLVSLSSDSVPEVVEQYEAPSTPSQLRDSLGAVLFCRQQRAADRPSPNGPSLDWRGFTFSAWQADAATKRVAERLTGYRALVDHYPTRVLTPGGQGFDCYYVGMMD